MNDERHEMMRDLIPADWDQRPMDVADRIRAFLKTIADPDTNIDSGMSQSGADLWVKVNGVEYFISLSMSNAQKAKEFN